MTADTVLPESEVAETSRGPVEFARVGDAPYILFCHGTPGGYDQGLGNAELAAAGFGTIYVSRPGYLRTPLSTGSSMAEQADAMAALLDVLGIEKVVVHGVSGGGPSAIEYAGRHPDRASGLLLSCAITQRFVVDAMPAWMVGVFMSDTSVRLQAWAMDRFPKASIEAMLRAESTFDRRTRKQVAAQLAASPDALARLRALTRSVSRMKERRAGFENDLKCFATIDELPLQAIRCPTLICHGTADGDVPFAHAETAHYRIPDAGLHRMENAWHLLPMSDGAEEMLRIQREFLTTCCG